MDVARSEDIDADSGPVAGKPFWLELGDDHVYGVLHTPRSAGPARIAALILPTFGWDNDCSYRGRRDWATALAESGVAVARIDFPGTENSVGSPLDPDRVRSWTDATISAADWLRQQSGCERLVAIGIGLGGLIAYQAVAAEAAIDDLVLWGVRASGRAYLRELRAYAAVVAGGIEDTESGARADGAIGIGGHLMSAQTIEQLSAIDLTNVPLPEARLRRVLLLGRDAHGVDEKLRRHLEGSGAAVTVIEVGDYHRLMAPPELGQSPTETIAVSIDWLHPSSANIGPPRRLPARTVPEAVDEVEFEYDGVSIRERLAEIDTTAGRLVGIVSEPPPGSARAPYCLVVLNSGALRHTGPNRIFVEIARRAAADGVPTARLDLPGLGDSDGTSVRTYERTAEHDTDSLAIVAEIYDHLQRLHVADRFVAIGLCLGGYLSVRAVLEDERSIGAISANPPAFKWTDAQRKRVMRELALAVGAEQVAVPKGRDRLPRVLRATVDRMEGKRRAIEARGRQRLANVELLWRLWHRAGIADVPRTLDRLGSTRASVLLLFSQDETLLLMLDQPKMAAKLQGCPNLKVERLPTRDHLLRPLSSQEMFLNRVSRALTELRSVSEQPGALVAPGQPASKVRPIDTDQRGDETSDG